jgi:subtilisin family serine protease
VKTLAFSLSGAAQNQPIIVDAEGTLAGFINLAVSTSGHPNGDGNISVQIHNAGDADLDISARLWSFTFVSTSSGRIDLWAGVPVPESFPVQGALGTTVYGNSDMTTGSPSTAQQLISVGSYVTTNAWTSMDGPQQTSSVLGSASAFSSKGPTRDGRMAPTVSAPGEMIGSTLSSSLASYSPMNSLTSRLPSRNVVVAQGTSMAAPHVAGTVALLLQYRPQLTVNSLRGILHRSSRHDSFAPHDDNTFGFGKLSAEAAVRDVLTSVLDDMPSPGIRAWPVPASTVISVAGTLAGAPYWAINAMGQRVVLNVRDYDAEAVALDVASLTPGMWTIVWGTDAHRSSVPVIIAR